MLPILLGRAQLGAVKFASKEVHTRPQLCGVLILPDGSTVATSGHVLVQVSPVTADTSHYPQRYSKDWPTIPEAGVILPSQAAIDAAKAVAKVKHPHIPILHHAAVASVNGTIDLTTTDLDTTSTVSARPIDFPYPNVKQIEPKGEPTYRIGFDLHLLKQVVDGLLAMDGAKGMAQVVIEFWGPLGACRLTRTLESGETVKALAMPLRLDAEAK